MMQRPGPDEQISLDDLLRKLSVLGNRIARALGTGGANYLLLGIFVIALLWLSTGIYTVDQGQQAALRLFGKFNATSGPGLHWYWPAPIGTRNVELIDVTRSMELGFRTVDPGPPPRVAPVPVESLMITGDENIVDVEMVVQYKIKDLGNFLFRVSDPGEIERGIAPGRPEGRTLKDAAEVALRQVVGSRPIDDVLTVEKSVVQVETQELLQELLDDYHAGLQVLLVKLQNVQPPEEVKAAFEDVVSAKEDRERTVNEAQGYSADILPRAEGEAAKKVLDAEAFAQERIEEATGEAARFLSILAEYRQSKEVTRQRLYLEAMEEILPGVTKFIVDSDTEGNLLQFLPLEETP